MAKTLFVSLSIIISTQCLAQIQPLKKDVSAVDGMINAFYEIVSGPAGQKRNWDFMFRGSHLQQSLLLKANL